MKKHILKVYEKPLLNKIVIDNEISLVMVSPPGDPPDGAPTPPPVDPPTPEENPFQ